TELHRRRPRRHRAPADRRPRARPPAVRSHQLLPVTPILRRGDAMSPYRVIQWAPGLVGKMSLKGILTHPDLELAGLWVHSPGKAGLDAGEFCGLPATGVVSCA